MTDTPHSTDPLRQRLAVELEKYGLPVPTTADAHEWEHAFETLLQHIYANHQLTLAMSDKSFEFLEKRLAELTEKKRD